MNEAGKLEEDILKKYLSPEKIEKAPESVTDRIMNRIRIEPASGMISVKTQKRSLIPLISCIVTALLIFIVLLLPESSFGELPRPVSDLFKNLNISFPDLNNLHLPSIDIPVLLTSLFVAIFLLGLLDKFLTGLFHKGSK